MINPDAHLSWLDIINSGMLVAVLGGIGHLLVSMGAVKTKVDTMWD